MLGASVLRNCTNNEVNKNLLSKECQEPVMTNNEEHYKHNSALLSILEPVKQVSCNDAEHYIVYVEPD